jgi:hypothetical protein
MTSTIDLPNLIESGPLFLSCDLPSDVMKLVTNVITFWKRVEDTTSFRHGSFIS